MAVIVAFVAGTIATATPVFAPPEKAGGDTLVAAAIDALTAVMQNTATQGPEGEQGPASGVQGYYTKATPCTILSTDSQKTCQVSCDSGDVLVNIGGAYDFSPLDITRRDSVIGGTPLSIGSVTFNNPSGQSTVGQLLPTCADFDPAHTP